MSITTTIRSGSDTRLLGGLQHREAVAGSDASETTGIAEGEIIWSPSGMTTVRASLTRGIEDAAQSGLFSYTYTSAQVTLDYEYARNILLNLSAGVRDATFNQTGGHSGRTGVRRRRHLADQSDITSWPDLRFRGRAKHAYFARDGGR